MRYKPLPNPIDLRKQMLYVCGGYTLLWAVLVILGYFAGFADDMFVLVCLPILYVMQIFVFHGEQAPHVRIPGVVALIFALIFGLLYCGLAYASLNLIDILARITRMLPAFMYRHGGLIALSAYLAGAGVIFLTGRILSRYSFLRLTVCTLVIGYAAMVGIYQVIGYIWPAQMNLHITDDIATVQYYTSRGLCLILGWAIGPVGYLWANRDYHRRSAIDENDDLDDLAVNDSGYSA